MSGLAWRRLGSHWAGLVRMSGRWPDVRGDVKGRMSGVMAGCPGRRGRLLYSLDSLSGCLGWRPDFRGDELDAGCPGLQEWPDVRAGGRMSGLAVQTSVVSG